MRIRKIDKEIMEEFFHGEKMKMTANNKDQNIRSYTSKDKKCGFIIGMENNKALVGLLINTMIEHKDQFNVIITNYKKMLVGLILDKSLQNDIIKHAQKPVENNYDEDDEDEFDEDLPYAYTNGQWTPCPYCGSRNVTTFCDGTAKCDECGREYRYLQF